jgi:hypothetical protein
MRCIHSTLRDYRYCKIVLDCCKLPIGRIRSHPCRETACRHNPKKASRGPRLTPRGLPPQHLRGAEGGGATPHNMGRARQQERGQATAHQGSSKHTFTSRHVRISNRNPNHKDIAGKIPAQSSRIRAGRKRKGSRSYGMHKRRTSAGSKEARCSA